MTTQGKVFSIVVRTTNAPKSGGGRYRKYVRILLVQGAIKDRYRRGDPDIIKSWENLDNRYSGPRSAYGKAMRDACVIYNKLDRLEAIKRRLRLTAAEEVGLVDEVPIPILCDRLNDLGFPEVAVICQE